MLYFDNVYLVLLSCVPLLQLVLILIEWVSEITGDLAVLLLCYRAGKLQYCCTFRSRQRHRKWIAFYFWILFSDFVFCWLLLTFIFIHLLLITFHCSSDSLTLYKTH